MKPKYSLIPPAGLYGVASVLTWGEKKHKDGKNKGLESGLTTQEMHDKIMRHLEAMRRGEHHDPESGMPHSWHVAANAIFLAARR